MEYILFMEIQDIVAFSINSITYLLKRDSSVRID